MRLLRPRQHDVALEYQSIFRGQVLLHDVDREELPVITIRVAPSAGEHPVGVGTRRHADEDTFLRAPRRSEPVQS